MARGVGMKQGWGWGLHVRQQWIHDLGRDSGIGAALNGLLGREAGGRQLAEAQLAIHMAAI